MRASGGSLRRGRRVPAAACAVAVALLVAACGPSPTVEVEAARPDGWLEFHGAWNATGSRHSIPLGPDRRAAIVDLSGTMLLAGPSRPGVGFRAQVIGLADTATGFTGRAVWTDSNGDRIFSEMVGQGAATGNRVEGAIVGGTGRYSGATGAYEFAWQYVLQSDDGAIQGRATDLKGRVRIEPAPRPPR